MAFFYDQYSGPAAVNQTSQLNPERESHVELVDLKSRLEQTQKELEETKKSLYSLLLDRRKWLESAPGVTDLHEYTSIQLRDVLSMSKMAPFSGDLYELDQANLAFKLASTLEGHKGAVYDCAFCPKADFAISCSFDAEAILWDFKSGSHSKIPSKHESPIVGVEWRHFGCIATAGLHGSVCSWSVSQNMDIKCTASYFLDGLVTSVATAMINENQYLVASSTRGGVSVFDNRSGKCARTYNAGEAIVNSIVIDEENGQILSGDARGVLNVMDIGSEKIIDSFRSNGEKTYPVANLALTSLSHETKRHHILAVSSYDNVIELYELNTNKSKSFTLKQHLKGHRNTGHPVKASFANSDDGSSCVLATGSCDNKVVVYKCDDLLAPGGSAAGTKFPIHVVEGHLDKVYTVSFHPRKRLLLSGSADYSLKLWSYREL